MPLGATTPGPVITTHRYCYHPASESVACFALFFNSVRHSAHKGCPYYTNLYPLLFKPNPLDYNEFTEIDGISGLRI